MILSTLTLKVAENVYIREKTVFAGLHVAPLTGKIIKNRLKFLERENLLQNGT